MHETLTNGSQMQEINFCHVVSLFKSNMVLFICGYILKLRRGWYKNTLFNSHLFIL